MDTKVDTTLDTSIEKGKEEYAIAIEHEVVVENPPKANKATACSQIECSDDLAGGICCVVCITAFVLAAYLIPIPEEVVSNSTFFPTAFPTRAPTLTPTPSGGTTAPTSAPSAFQEDPMEWWETMLVVIFMIVAGPFILMKLIEGICITFHLFLAVA